MSVASAIVTAISATIPPFARERYREEWMADLAGARELELPESSVVGGAAMTALTINRSDPLVTGITTARLVARRMRWAAAFLGSAAVLGFGGFVRGDFSLRGDDGSLALAPIGFAIQSTAALFAVCGLFAGLSALAVAFGSNARRAALVVGVGLVAITVSIAMMLFIPAFALLGVPLVLATIIVGTSGEKASTTAQSLPAWGRAALSLSFSLLTFAVIVAGVLHITVWNPLAKAPGLSLDEIYAAMAAANESPATIPIVAWAALWGLAAIVLPTLATLPRLGLFFTAQRIVVAGLFLVGATAGFLFFANFNMGMSLADTFMTSGWDAAISGSVIAVIGQIALVIALLVGLSPRALKAELAHSTEQA